MSLSLLLNDSDDGDFRPQRRRLRRTLNLSTQDLFYVKLTGLLVVFFCE